MRCMMRHPRCCRSWFQWPGWLLRYQWPQGRGDSGCSKRIRLVRRFLVPEEPGHIDRKQEYIDFVVSNGFVRQRNRMVAEAEKSGLALMYEPFGKVKKITHDFYKIVFLVAIVQEKNVNVINF